MKRLNCLTPFIESGKRLHPDYLEQSVQPKPLEALTLEELIESLPLPPLDPNDPDPLMQKVARSINALAPEPKSSGK